MAVTRNQFPQGYQISDGTGRITDPYYFFLQTLDSSLPPPGAGYVVDGTFGTTGLHLTEFWGLDSLKGTPLTDGYVYFSTDTGKIYISNGSTWELESPAYTGSVIKAVGSTTTVLSNVLATPGTFGALGTTAQITVNSEGRITAVHDVPNSTSPGGNYGDVQFNNSGLFGGVDAFHYDTSTDTLELLNELVDGQISFVNPIPTRTNLLPVQTGLAGDVLTTNGTDVSWETLDTQTPYYIGPGETFTVFLDKQVLYSEPITIDVGGSLVVNGSMIQVPIVNVDSLQTPYHILSGQTFTVDNLKQVLFAEPITVDVGGSLIVNGSLIDVGSGSVTSVNISSPGSTITVGGGPITSIGTLTVDLPHVGPGPGSFTNANISIDNQGRITAASNGSTGVTSVTASPPLSSSGGSTPNISITQSNTSTDGYLSSTDWNTFNNKVPGPAGSTTWVQYNNSGVFGADAGFTYNSAGGITLTDLGNAEILMNLASIQCDTFGNFTFRAGDDPTFSGGGQLEFFGGQEFGISSFVTGGGVLIQGGHAYNNTQSQGGGFYLQGGTATGGALQSGDLIGGNVNIGAGFAEDTAADTNITYQIGGILNLFGGDISAENYTAAVIQPGNVLLRSGVVTTDAAQTGPILNADVQIQGGQIRSYNGGPPTAAMTGGSVQIQGSNLDIGGAAAINQIPGNVELSGGIEVFAPGKVGKVSVMNTDLRIENAGSGLKIKGGTNCKLGTSTLVGGIKVVSNTSITSNSKIFYNIQNANGGTPGALYLSNIVAGTGFTIHSTSLLDTSIVAWNIIESI